MNPILAHSGDNIGIGTYGTDWFYLLVPFAAFLAVVAYLAVSGSARVGGVTGILLRISDSLTRLTGLPAWSAGGIGVGMFALIVAVIGFYWDVSWHIELGRDEFIYTPAHMMIVAGLALIVASAITTILLATVVQADVGKRLGRFVVPYSAIPIALLGLGALTGFPLDEFWHKAYGVDVTMWGPTHLVMISGASLTPIALCLILTEAGRTTGDNALLKGLRMVVAGAVLIGLSTWTGEFDFGVPQFQQLYHPVLVAMAASMGLVMARKVLGPGGAFKAVLVFLATRSAVALLLGGSLGILIPRYPLYLGAALVVELAARLLKEGGALRAAVITGLGVGTLGLAFEWGWTQVWGHHPWGPALFPGILAATAMAIVAAVLGSAMGDVLIRRKAQIPRAALAVAGLCLIGLLVVPFPRNNAPIEAVVTTGPVKDGFADLEIALEPKDAAEPADWFEVQSWQGGALQNTPLREVSPGTYEAVRPVPVSGDWKSFIRIAKNDVMVAVPVYLPADPEIGASEIPLLPRREATFQRDTELLLREAREGAALPAILAYTAILILALVWIVGLVWTFAAVGRERRSSPPAAGAGHHPAPVKRRAEAHA
jgi:hypothetical protein